MSRVTSAALGAALTALLTTLLTALLTVGPAPGPAAAGAAPAAAAEPWFDVLSYNVRNPDAPGGAAYRWSNRGAAVVSLIDGQDPDVFGIQEARAMRLEGGTYLPDPASDIATAFAGGDSPKYGVVVPSSYTETRDAAWYAGYRAVPKLIFYRKDRFHVVRRATDAVPIPNPYAGTGSDCDKSSDNRSLMWAVLEDDTSPTDQRYFVVNTHLAASAACYAARNVGARTVQCTIQAQNTGGLPAIVMGDFNNDDHRPGGARPNENSLATMEARQRPDDHVSCSTPFESGGYQLTRTMSYAGETIPKYGTTTGTWPAPDRAWQDNTGNRLDYIFAAQRLQVQQHGTSDILRGKVAYGGVRDTPSDHYAVWARLRFVP